VDASVDSQNQQAIRDPAETPLMTSVQTAAPLEFHPAIEEQQELASDVLARVARLEASTGVALSLLRRCIVEEATPTREALASEAEFAFGMPGEAALAEIDQVAEMMGVSSLR
jgi:hypothetical protein